MAKPQLEDGHVRLANDLFEAITHAPLSGSQFRVLLAIIRETYGWHKTEAAISQRRLEDLTGISSRSWLTAVTKSLEQGGIIHCHHVHGKSTVYALSKDYELWQTIQLQQTSQSGLSTSSEQNSTIQLQSNRSTALQLSTLGVDTVLHENHVKPKENHAWLSPPYAPKNLSGQGLYKVPLVKAYLDRFNLKAIPHSHRKRLEPELVTLSYQEYFPKLLGDIENCRKCFGEWCREQWDGKEIKPLLFIMRWIARRIQPVEVEEDEE